MVQQFGLEHGTVFLGNGGLYGLDWDPDCNSLHNAIASEGGGQYVKTGTRKFHFGPGHSDKNS